MPFSSLGLSAPLLQAVAEKNYASPSPIQEKAIPAVLSGSDVLAAAQTGTGKTAGFTLPILEKLSKGKSAGSNQVRALILVPTRELAAQVADSVASYGRHLSLRSAVAFGGVKINPQMMKLRKGVDILVATPGRLIDLHSQNAVKFSRLEVLVLDEADRMLDMGFMPDIRRILKALPDRRQNLMFSATFSAPVRKLASGIVHRPIELSVAPKNSIATTIKQSIYPVDKKRKPLLLLNLLRKNDWRQVLVFTRTKHGANRLARDLEANGILAAAIHGNKSQSQRTKVLAEFKKGELCVLVATDIAARGLDIDQLPQVVNFELPNVPEDYVHRIGRTGRAGAEGHAVSLVCADELRELIDIERVIQQVLPRKIVEGFEPVNMLPDTHLGQRPPRKRKASIESGKPSKKRRPSKNKKSVKSSSGSKGSAGSKNPRESTSSRKKDTSSSAKSRGESTKRDESTKKTAGKKGPGGSVWAKNTKNSKIA